MTYAAHPTDFPQYQGDARTRHEATPRKPGILQRLFRAVYASRQTEADRQIASFLARSGGRFTDAMERELSERVATGDWDRRSPFARF